MLEFLINGLSFFKDLIKICITYGWCTLCIKRFRYIEIVSILFCGCLKNKCLDNNNEEINDNIKSPTPLLNPNNKHPILEAYERSIIAKLHPEAEASENKIINQINSNE